MPYNGIMPKKMPSTKSGGKRKPIITRVAESLEFLVGKLADKEGMTKDDLAAEALLAYVESKLSADVQESLIENENRQREVLGLEKLEDPFTERETAPKDADSATTPSNHSPQRRGTERRKKAA